MCKVIIFILMAVFGPIVALAHNEVSEVFIIAETGGFESNASSGFLIDDNGNWGDVHEGCLWLFVKFPESLKDTAIPITFEEQENFGGFPFKENGSMISFYIKTDFLLKGSTPAYIGIENLYDIRVIKDEKPCGVDQGIIFVKGAPLSGSFLEEKGLIGWPFQQYVECLGVVNSYGRDRSYQYFSVIENNMVTKVFPVANISVLSPMSLKGDYDFMIPHRENDGSRNGSLSFDPSIVMREGARIKFYIPEGYFDKKAEGSSFLYLNDVEGCLDISQP
ncbi:MAG: hypothetical protein JXR56_03055 [Candidatus Cloacimonetes bacterium]|nr:hypothetical protein [Candidatus Cloacimonadota bacterium]